MALAESVRSFELLAAVGWSSDADPHCGVVALEAISTCPWLHDEKTLLIFFSQKNYRPMNR